MSDKRIRVLLIEDNPGDARLIREALADAGPDSFDLECIDRLSAGLDRLARGGIDSVLLDLSLPDACGLDTFTKVHAHSPGVPIIVLTGLDDETLATETVHNGAQDYLVKGQVDSNLLVRSIRYGIERQRLLAELRAMSLVDDLTGLSNRRGFLTLGVQQLKLADRMKRAVYLFFIDVDGMKWINDTLGHRQGDLALMGMADMLRESFRQSDVIARIGGDEFAVVAIETGETNIGLLTSRLWANIEAHNERVNHRYKLSVSVGMACYDPACPCSIDELLAEADSLMYEEKRAKTKSVAAGLPK